MINKQCIICKKYFLTYPSHDKKLCSIQCAYKNRKGKPSWNKGTAKVVIQKCNICEKEFSKRKGDHKKYCSEKCSRDAVTGNNNIRWKGGKIDKFCEICNKSFSAWPFEIINSRKFCSKKCAGIFNGNNKRGKFIPNRVSLRRGKIDPNISTLFKNVAIIHIKNYDVIIDSEDLEKVSKIRWCMREFQEKNFFRLYVVSPRRIKLHRFIMGAAKGQIVDHINGDGLDNRKSNLRITNLSGNAWNRRKGEGLSQYKGVKKQKSGNTWMAKITHNYKEIYLGNFPTEIEAAQAYDRAALKLFGQFANLNFKS